MADRWWTYQRERFPLASFTVLSCALAFSALAFSALVRGVPSLPDNWTLAAAAASALLLFAQMRVLDEFKDFEDDKRFRVYRAVPRGLVTLGQLGWIGAAATVAELALALSVDTRLAWLLAAVWAYLALMAAEFFAPDWLKARPLAYLVSHVPVAALITLYLTAFDWLPAGAAPRPALLPFAVAAVCATTLLEIGRKIRAPHDEEAGVVTYSGVWGRNTAVGAWLAALALTLAAGWLAASAIGFAVQFSVLGILLAAAALAVGLRFTRSPETSFAQHLELLSGVATLALYLGLGPLALILAI